MSTLIKLTATLSLALLGAHAQANGTRYASPTPEDTTFSFTSGTVNDSFGNSFTKLLDGTTLTATAWSTTGNGGTFENAELEIYSGNGMGVCNRNEGLNCSDSNNNHGLDDNGPANDLILFSFSGPVQLDTLSLRQFGGDSDLSVWAGTGTLNLAGLTPAALGTATLINNSNNSSNTNRTIDLGNVLSGNYTWLAVASRIGGEGDSAKLRSLTVNPVTAPVPEAETWAMMLAGLGLVGFAVRRRTC